jgi:hypothetical protein
MMDLGPNGDKRKIYQLSKIGLIKTGSYKLDNPVWHSLSENHKEYGITYDETLFYAEYCPFGAALNTKKFQRDCPIL